MFCFCACFKYDLTMADNQSRVHVLNPCTNISNFPFSVAIPKMLVCLPISTFKELCILNSLLNITIVHLGILYL